MYFVVVWGTKLKRKKMGRVADYCPLCHEFRAFSLYRVGEASHVYYISVGQGKLVGHEIECETCGISLGTELSDYVKVSSDALGSSHELIAETFPDLKERQAERLEGEREARSPAAPPETRMPFLFEPFTLLEHMVELRASNTHFDKKSGLGCAASVLSLPIIVVGAALENGLIAGAGVVLLAVFALATLFWLATDLGRFTRANVLPMLARGLRPFQPSQEELDSVLGELKAAKYKIAKKVKSKELLDAVRQPESQGEAIPPIGPR